MRGDGIDQPPWVVDAILAKRRANALAALAILAAFVGLIVCAAIPQLTPIFVVIVVAGLFMVSDR